MNAASLSQKNRIAGGLIDRGKPLNFRFDGQHYTGFSGDTLASALLANNVRLVGRSFKYHRPRGILTAGSEEPNALVTIGSGASQDPNCRATTTELFDSLTAKSQTKVGFLSFDLMAINDLLSPILGWPFGKSYMNRSSAKRQDLAVCQGRLIPTAMTKVICTAI